MTARLHDNQRQGLLFLMLFAVLVFHSVGKWVELTAPRTDIVKNFD